MMDNARPDEQTTVPEQDNAATMRALRRASILAGLTAGAYVLAATAMSDPTATLATCDLLG